MTPTSASSSSNHVNASHAASQASRARSPQAGQGASPFAQLLQGMSDEGEETNPVATPSDAESASTEAAESNEEHGKPHAARNERDPAEDGTPQAPQEPVANPDLAATVRQAAMAAARAKAAAGVDAGRGHRAPAGQDTLADTARAAAGTSLAHAAARDAQTSAAGSMDLPGWQPALDATPVNLAATEPAAGSSATPDFSLPSLGATAPAAAAPAQAPAAQATLAPPPGSAAFAPALGAQLNTWLQDGVQYATLELNPQDMGPIDVRIALRDGRTEVQLGADVAATRAALTEALPELADALGDVGLTLAGGSVSDQTGQHARQGEGQAQRGFTMPSWLAPARDDVASAADATRRPAQRGLVDLVA